MASLTKCFMVSLTCLFINRTHSTHVGSTLLTQHNCTMGLPAGPGVKEPILATCPSPLVPLYAIQKHSTTGGHIISEVYVIVKYGSRPTFINEYLDNH